jgi:SH3 domain protein
MMNFGMKLKLFAKASLIGALLLAFYIGPAVAETRYVSDLLIISIREGQSDEAPILGYLISDTPVEVIEEDENGEFVKVETPEGLVGWVKKRFLNTKLPKSTVIKELEDQVKNLEEKIVLLQQNAAAGESQNIKAEYENKINSLQETITNEKRNVLRLQNELKQLKAQNKILAEKQPQQPPDVKKELLELKEKNQELMTEIQRAQRAQKHPETTFYSGNIKWFLAGAGVLILGVIVGRSLRRKPRYRY